MKNGNAAEYLWCLLFPNHCKFCGELTDFVTDICDKCKAEIPFIKGEICYRCGSQKADCICNGKRSKFYEKSVSVMYYDELAKNCISRFKFDGDRNTYKCLAKLMVDCCAERYADVSFDYVAYVPMDRKKQRARGFNQSKLLAKVISDELNIPFGEKLLVKLYETDNQHECDRIERTGNLMGVFDVNGDYDISGKSILLVDDIKTSGATLNECGKMLYLYGAQSVFCLTAARRNSKIDEKEEDGDAGN